MRFIHTGDLHLGRVLGDLSLLDDQRHALDQIIAYIKAYKVDALLIAGDVYQKASPQADAMELFDAFLNKAIFLNCKVFVVSGNHDSGQRIDYFGRLIEKSGVYPAGKSEKTLRRYALEDGEGPIYVYLLPFVRPHNVRSLRPDAEIKSNTDAVKLLLDSTQIDYSARNVLIAHQYITGGELSGSEELSVGTLDNVDSQILEQFDYVALGHLHGAQRVGKPYIRYSGSPLKYSFGECDQKKGVDLVELKGKGELSVTQLPIVPLRDVRHVYCSFSDIDSAQKSDDYIWLTINDELPPRDWYRRAQDVFPNLVRHDVLNSKTRVDRIHPEAADVRNALSPEQLFVEFYSSQNNGVEPSKAQTELFLQLYKEAQLNETA